MATVLPISRRVRADRSVAAIVGASLFTVTSALAADEAAKPQGPTELAEVVVSVERVTQTLQSYAGTAVTATQAQLVELRLRGRHCGAGVALQRSDGHAGAARRAGRHQPG